MNTMISVKDERRALSFVDNEDDDSEDPQGRHMESRYVKLNEAASAERRCP